MGQYKKTRKAKETEGEKCGGCGQIRCARAHFGRQLLALELRVAQLGLTKGGGGANLETHICRRECVLRLAGIELGSLEKGDLGGCVVPSLVRVEAL